MLSKLRRFQSTKLTPEQRAFLKLQYSTVYSDTDNKFDAWLVTLEEQWTSEISACLQGQFPDWRS